MGILVFERDLGMATLLLATFVAMLYVATRRVDLVAGATAIFGLAAWLAATHYAYVERRIAVWRDPFHDPLGAGYQAVQSLFALANGGLFGTGFGLGRPDFIPEVATDYVYAAYGEEWGAIGSIVLAGAFLALVLRALRVAERQPDLYAKLLATGLATVLGLPGAHHHRRSAPALSAHRDHAAVRLVRRQLARDELSAGRAGLGDLERTPNRKEIVRKSKEASGLWIIGPYGRVIHRSGCSRMDVLNNAGR